MWPVNYILLWTILKFFWNQLFLYKLKPKLRPGKKNVQQRSTTTAGLAVQSALARALNDGEFALLANLDLSSAFDVVNVKLLLKRMRIAGLPSDIVKLIEIWLVERRCFVTVNGKNSFIKMSDIGTVQGSILGPFI